MIQKKGVSGVITAIMMIALVMAAVTIIWVSVNKMIKDKVSDAESCFDVGFSEKVTINNDYTCYDSDLEEVQFSINIGDIEIDELLVSISAGGTSKSFTISNEEKTIEDLVPYPSGSGNIKLPEENSGLTYTASGFSSEPDSIKIAPIVNAKQCEASDSLFEIDSC